MNKAGQGILLVIRFWFKDDYCFTIVSSDGLIYYINND